MRSRLGVPLVSLALVAGGGAFLLAGPVAGAVPTPSISSSPSNTPSPSPTSGSHTGTGSSPVAITLAVTPAEITAGNKPVLSGLVTDKNGAAVRNSVVTFDRQGWGETAMSSAGTTDTDSTGHFSLAVQPMVQTKYWAHAGDITSAPVLVRVHRRINIDSPQPTPGRVGPDPTWHGTVLPVQANLAVGLAYKDSTGYHYLTQTRTNSSGQWSMHRGLPQGTHTFVVYTSASAGTLYGSKSQTQYVDYSY